MSAFPSIDTFQETTISVLPMFHMFALNVTAMPLHHAGGKLVSMPAFKPDTFIAALEKYKPSFQHFAPPLVQFCAYNPAVTSKHLESLEYIMIGAAPVGEAVAKAFKAKAPNCQFREGWGMTETGPVVLLTPHKRERLTSCGVLVPQSEAKIVHLETGEALGPNKTGELVVRGPQVTNQYLAYGKSL